MAPGFYVAKTNPLSLSGECNHGLAFIDLGLYIVWTTFGDACTPCGGRGSHLVGDCGGEFFIGRLGDPNDEVGRIQCLKKIEGGSPVQINTRGMFTDRDQGEGFVLSASTGSSGTTEHKNIKPNGINTAGDGPMKGHLFGMGEQVSHRV